MRVLFWLTLVLFLAGCVEDKPEVPDVDNEPQFGEIVDTPPAPRPVDPFIEPDEPAGFTGAKVYSSAFCIPCQCLEADLHWLVNAHAGWSLSRDPDADADWLILPPDADHQRTPHVEFYRNGTMFDESFGYSTERNAAARRAALLALVRIHPNSKAANR